MSREKACVSFIRPFQALALSVCVLAAAFTAAAQPTAAAPASGIDSSFIDPAVRVQDDLFRHVNGGWLERTPIPPDRASTGAFEQLHEAIQPQLRTLIEEAAAARRDAEASQIGDLYASFMGEAALEKLGVKPIAAELAAIDAVADRSQLARLMARAIRAGISMPIALDIHQDGRDPTRYIADLSQGGLGLPDRDYYLLDDPRFKQVRGSYLVYMARMLALAGERKTAHIARAVLALETALARAQWTQLENQDPVRIYNKVELTALPELAPGFNWASFLAGTGLAGTVGDVIVSQPSYVTALGRQIEHAPLDVWKAYAKLRMLDAYARPTSTRPSSTCVSPSPAPRCAARPRTHRAGSAAWHSSKPRSATAWASATCSGTFRPRTRRAWKSSSPICWPPTARALPRSTG